MHDEGTGGNSDGGYGIFPLFPLMNCTFASCPVGLSARETKRAAGADGKLLHSRKASSDLDIVKLPLPVTSLRHS